jgi:hypothetical protein
MGFYEFASTNSWLTFFLGCFVVLCVGIIVEGLVRITVVLRKPSKRVIDKINE